MEIRLLAPKEFGRLAASYPERAEDQLAQYFNDQARGLVSFFAAWDGLTPLGYAIVALGREHTEHDRCSCQECQISQQRLEELACPVVLDLLVHRSHRRQGLGQALLEVVEAAVFSVGADGICLALASDAFAAQQLCQQTGYLTISHGAPLTRQLDPANEHVDIIHMRKPLRQGDLNHTRQETLTHLSAQVAERSVQVTNTPTTADDDLSRCVERLLGSPEPLSPKEAFQAALILYHTAPADSGQAVGLAHLAVSAGYDEARWLFAAALDRLRIARGQEQYFGTQFKKTWYGWRSYQVRQATTDHERQAWDADQLTHAGHTPR